MKKTYISPEIQEIKVDDVITASILNTANEGAGLNLNFSELDV